MSVRLGLVGMGHVAQHHVSAVASTDGLELACTCDLGPRDPEFEHLSLPHYLCAEEMLERCPLDVAIIATPPGTHGSLSCLAFEAGLDILLEKPATPDRAAFNNLLAAARARHRRLDVALHAAFGREMVWFEEHQSALYQQFGPPVFVSCQFHDPYANTGALSGEAAGLGGCWRDSSINALSVLDRILPLDAVDVRDACLAPQADRPDLHVAGVVHLTSPDCDATIETNWLTGENLKKTFIRFSERSASLLLHHSGECVEIIDGKKVERVSLANGQPRLDNHYRALFAAYAESLRHGEGFGPAARLHTLMFDALDKSDRRLSNGQ